MRAKKSSIQEGKQARAALADSSNASVVGSSVSIPFWQEVCGKIRKFPRDAAIALITTLLLSLIANLSEEANIRCWPRYLMLHESVLIWAEPYHIGDVERTWFRHPPPGLNPFTASFRLCRVTDTMYLTMQAVHVDPDVTTSPVPVFINGQFVDYLNLHSTGEVTTPMTLTIQIPNARDVLQVGANNIMIMSGADQRGLEYGVYNIDDLEFWDLRINR